MVETMTTVRRAMPGEDTENPGRRWLAMMAALVLVAGLAHVWLHYSGAVDSDHFGQSVVDDCLLCELPLAATTASIGPVLPTLFFASFAVVITLAVNLAGVLLVFAFLIIPVFSASLLARTFGARLLLGWSFGVVGSLAGLWVSYNADLPVGATMVAVLGALPIVAALIAALARTRRRAAAP